MEAEKEISLIYRAYGRNLISAGPKTILHMLPRGRTGRQCTPSSRSIFKNPGNPDDKPTRSLTVEEMQVTTTGQVSTSLGGETVFTLNREESDKLAAKLDSLRTDQVKFIPGVLNSARNLSGYKDPSEVNEPVFFRKVP